MGLGINQVSSSASTSKIDTGSDNALSNQLMNLITEYRAHMGDADQTTLRGIMQQIQSFLAANKSLIMEQCAMNGYNNNSPDWTQHYATFFDHAQSIIENDLSSPGPFSTHLLNEQITQLHFLMATPQRQ